MTADLGTIVDAHTVRFERLLPGPIGRLWDYLTRPELLATWLAEAEIEPRVGGQVELRFNDDVDDCRPPGDEPETVGTITRWDPPRALAYSWADSEDTPEGHGSGPDSEVTFELEERGADVLLVLTHRRLATPAMPGFGAGWHSHLDALAAGLRQAAPVDRAAVYRALLPRYRDLAAAVGRTA